MEFKRVVITGIGAITPIQNLKQDLLVRLKTSILINILTGKKQRSLICLHNMPLWLLSKQFKIQNLI